MPQIIKATAKRRKVLFMSNAARAYPTSGRNPSTNPDEHTTPHPSARVQELDALEESDLVEPNQDTEYLFPRNVEMPVRASQPNIPELFTNLPPIRDLLNTETSLLQDNTVQECLPFLAGTYDSNRSPYDFNAHGLPHLERQKHIDFLHDSLEEMPGGYVGYDASRPWIVYWAMAGLSLLGEDISQYRER